MTVVAGRALTRRFGDFTAVDGVDLTVERGEVVGILGANGAGKTTLIKMILGLLRPTSGSVALFGSPPARDTRRRVGYVPQGLGLWKDLTAAENLEFIAGAFAVAPAPAPAGAGDLPVGLLPLGVQRRVAFAAALQHRPLLLILDEPTSGVAPLARAGLWSEIRSRAESGTAVLVTTHYMDEARQADRLILMSQGRVVGSGSEVDLVAGRGAVVVTCPAWDAAFTALEGAGFAAGLSGGTVRVPGADPAEVLGALESAGVPASVAAVPATLEEVMVLSAPP